MAVPQSDRPAAPRGYVPAPQLTAQLHAIYHSLTGAQCLAEAYLSPRMGARTAGLYRQSGSAHQIVLSRRYLDLATQAQIENLMRHELAHYHLSINGQPRAGHGSLFRELMRSWRFDRYPDRDILRRIAAEQPRLRHLYLCPAGHEHWLSRHPRRRSVSCAICSPRYDRRHRLHYSGVSRRDRSAAADTDPRG